MADPVRFVRQSAAMTLAIVLGVAGPAGGAMPANAQQSPQATAPGAGLERPANPALRDSPGARSQTLAADLDATAEYYRGYRDALRDSAHLYNRYDRWRPAGRYTADSGTGRTWPTDANRQNRSGSGIARARDRDPDGLERRADQQAGRTSAEARDPGGGSPPLASPSRAALAQEQPASQGPVDLPR